MQEEGTRENEKSLKLGLQGGINRRKHGSKMVQV